MTTPSAAALASRCDLLRSLHRPGSPLLLPNAWDVTTAKAVVAAGFPAVATTSHSIAENLGHADGEGAPAEEMLAAAARIARSVDVPVTVDAEGGYGMAPADLVAALREVGAAGCNLEDTDHAGGGLRDPDAHAAWLGEVRRAADEQGYPLVINARVDVFIGPWLAGAGLDVQAGLVPDALRRAEAYLAAGADCVYPIALCEPAALADFMARFDGPVNLIPMPGGQTPAELAGLGAARISWGPLMHEALMERFREMLEAARP